MYDEIKAGRADLLAVAARPGKEQVAVAGRDATVRIFEVSVN